MKHAALQTETSELRGVQKQTAIEPSSPFIEFDGKDDNISINHKEESKPLNLPLTFLQNWDGFVEDRKMSPKPPPYDSVSCLLIILTPMLKDSSLHNESQMKELLSDLLTDPSMTCQRLLGTSPASSSTGSSFSSSHRPLSSLNHHPALPARRSTVSSTPPTLPSQSSQPIKSVLIPSQPNVPTYASAHLFL